nr:WGxxGxxG family protein [Paenibacillus sp. VKM B-2647]
MITRTSGNYTSTSYRANAAGDGATDWGWLGLLGLVGLAGLFGRNRSDAR